MVGDRDLDGDLTGVESETKDTCFLGCLRALGFGVASIVMVELPATGASKGLSEWPVVAKDVARLRLLARGVLIGDEVCLEFAPSMCVFEACLPRAG